MFNVKMNTIFKNFENSNKPSPHRLLINLTDIINVKRSDKYFTLSNPSIYDIWKQIKTVI